MSYIQVVKKRKTPIFKNAAEAKLRAYVVATKVPTMAGVKRVAGGIQPAYARTLTNNILKKLGRPTLPRPPYGSNTTAGKRQGKLILTPPTKAKIQQEFKDKDKPVVLSAGIYSQPVVLKAVAMLDDLYDLKLTVAQLRAFHVLLDVAKDAER